MKQMDTRQAAVWVMVLLTAAAAGGAAAQTLRVGLEAPECVHKGVTLLCDYSNSHQVVHIGGSVDESVHKVFVHNSESLLISESLCVNLSVTSVTNVTVVSDDQVCHSSVEFSSKSSTVNRLPSRANQIYMENSNITWLFSTTDIKQLTVINSFIDVLEVPGLLLDNIHAIFHSTKINTLKKMKMSHGSRLLFENTHINHLLTRSLVVEGGHVVMRDSSTRMASEDGIFMVDGSTLSLDNYNGSLRVTTASEQATRLSPIYAPTTARDCSVTVTYFGEYVACLVLMLLIVLCTLAALFIHLRKKSETWNRFNGGQSSPDPIHKEVANPEFLSDPFIGDHQEDEQKTFLLQVSGNEAELYLHNLEHLTQNVCTSMKKQKSRLEDELKAVEKECKAKLQEIDNRRHNRSQMEEDLINSELHDHETKYQSEEKRRNKNWDELTQLLLKIRDLKASKEALCNARNEEEAQQVEYTAKLGEANKRYLKALGTVGQMSLATWRNSRGSIGECHPNLAVMDDLIKHVVKSLNEELLTIIRRSGAKAELEQYIIQHKLNSLKEQRVKMFEDLNTKYKMKHLNLAKRTQTTAASTRTRNKLKKFYESKTEVLTLSQRLEQTALLSESSGHRLTMGHLTRTAQLQKQYINDMENILSMLEYVLRFNVKLVRKMLDLPSEDLPAEGDELPAGSDELPAGGDELPAGGNKLPAGGNEPSGDLRQVTVEVLADGHTVDSQLNLASD